MHHGSYASGIEFTATVDVFDVQRSPGGGRLLTLATVTRDRRLRQLFTARTRWLKDEGRYQITAARTGFGNELHVVAAEEVAA